MGVFTAQIGVSGGNGHTPTYVEATVDSGALYTMLPTDLLRRVGVEPYGHEAFEVADNRQVQMPVGEARITIGYKAFSTPVIFGEKCLLGASTLQMFRLIPDTTNHRLVPAPIAPL